LTPAAAKSSFSADSENVGQPDFNAFPFRQIYSGNSRHDFFLLKLSLSLLVLGFLADYHDLTVAFDNLAFIAHWLY
jgi:hypothetical protein